MHYRQFLILSALLLCSCGTTPVANPNLSSLFCDRYLIYPMCTQDVTGNGRADFVYFEDSQEIFLFNRKLVRQVPSHLTMHECAQTMDRKLIDATSLLLTVNDETGFFRRAEIKNGIFFHYMRYLPRVARCNPQVMPADKDAEDDFGVEENSENIDYKLQ